MSENNPNANKHTEKLSASDSNKEKRTTDETLSLSELRRSRPKPDLPSDDELIKQTTVLSRDNPILKRALNQQAAAGNDEEAPIGEQREVILVIRGMVERVVMTENVIYKLGRFELGLKNPDEVDLTPYGAADRGVSRFHAKMHIADDTLYITDLGSTNGTYLGGKRLEPNLPTELHKGDELLLGRLAIQVMFR